MISDRESDRQPIPDHVGGFLQEPEDASASPLACGADRIAARSPKVAQGRPRSPKVAHYHADQFGYAKPGSTGRMQHRPVPHAGCDFGVRSLGQGADFLPVELSD